MGWGFSQSLEPEPRCLRVLSPRVAEREFPGATPPARSAQQAELQVRLLRSSFYMNDLFYICLLWLRRESTGWTWPGGWAIINGFCCILGSVTCFYIASGVKRPIQSNQKVMRTHWGEKEGRNGRVKYEKGEKHRLLLHTHRQPSLVSSQSNGFLCRMNPGWDHILHSSLNHALFFP